MSDVCHSQPTEKDLYSKYQGPPQRQDITRLCSTGPQAPVAPGSRAILPSCPSLSKVPGSLPQTQLETWKCFSFILKGKHFSFYTQSIQVTTVKSEVGPWWGELEHWTSLYTFRSWIRISDDIEEKNKSQSLTSKGHLTIWYFKTDFSLGFNFLKI